MIIKPKDRVVNKKQEEVLTFDVKETYNSLVSNNYLRRQSIMEVKRDIIQDVVQKFTRLPDLQKGYVLGFMQRKEMDAPAVKEQPPERPGKPA